MGTLKGNCNFLGTSKPTMWITTCLATESSLQETSSRLKESIYLQEQEVHTKEAALQAYIKNWQSFIIYHDAAQIADEEKTTWLVQQLQHKRIEQKDRQNQIQSYATKKQALDTLQNGINDLDKQLNKNANAIKDTERNLQSLQERCIQYNNEQLNSNKTLSEIELKLSDYFTAQNWFQHWKDNPVSFLQRISNFAEEWKTNIQKLEEDTRQHSVLSATIKAIREQLQSLSTELQKKRTLLASIKEQHNLLTQKRKSIFNGEAATTIESGLKQAVLTAQEVLKKGKTESERLNIEIARTATQKEALQKDITSLQQQADVLVKKIHQWIIVFNIQHDLELDLEKLLQLLNFSTEWMEGERANLRAIDDTVTQTQSVLHELTKQSVQHEGQRLSERSIAELNELLNTAKTGLQLRTQEKNEIRFRLQQDAKDKQKIGDLLSFIQAKALIVENWAKLNEVIGSADGKKFRQIAQEYTLDVLLSYANVHLEMLSKRYLLQRVPNTLGLQVLDQDMGNEVRTVYSLSGGESFLVSLSLALGLASLSSSRMKVKSLFIDEGFGSLDPTTLNIAMDALERLHNQGRKVGVISHVQEMTERIPVQIKVSKQQSGRSKVEVIEL